MYVTVMFTRYPWNEVELELIQGGIRIKTTGYMKKTHEFQGWLVGKLPPQAYAAMPEEDRLRLQRDA